MTYKYTLLLLSLLLSPDQDKYKNSASVKGAVVRPSVKFHGFVGTPDFPAEKGRYRLYVAEACPWSHRTYMMWKLKGLDSGIVALTLTGYKLENISFEPPYDDYHGWDFDESEGAHHSQPKAGLYEEPHGFSHIEQLYELAHPGFRESYESKGQRPYYSAPVLFDEKEQKIVSTESADIIRMFNSVFDEVGAKKIDLAPKELEAEMEAADSIVYPKINDGVYRCGFATTQEAYSLAYHDHWSGMDSVESTLGSRRFLCGEVFTLSDVRLWVTLARYDSVYFSHFKTNRTRLKEMPNLYRYLRDVYRIPGIAETLNLPHIVKHYYYSQRMVNPTGIWPLGGPTEEFFTKDNHELGYEPYQFPA